MRPVLRFTRFALALALCGCGVPKNVVRVPSTAFAATCRTTLAVLVAPAVQAHPTESGFLLYNTGEGAIQARVALAEVAQASIDAQYFLWGGDAIGRVLLERIIAAADRGVRVRLLLDDYSHRGYDVSFEALSTHPNIEVRVFNPFARGRLRFTQFLGRFTELNHRMHNKVFIVDGQAAIVGGRNLTDEYFGLGESVDFRDFDLLAIGPVVPQAEAGFDLYWNSEWAYPITSLRKPASPAELQRLRARFAERVAADRAHFPYVLPRDATEALAWLAQFQGRAAWGPAEVIYDHPSVMAKPLGASASLVFDRLRRLVGSAEREIVGENAYLLPQKDAPSFRALRARGVDVRVLTNSLATTDEVAVNAHFADSRLDLVDLGVGLYEMKPRAASRERYIARSDESKARLALHGKAVVFDRKTVFVGSFNLDPRSMALDTETVFVVHSPQLASQFLAAFAIDFLPANAWRIGRVPGDDEAVWLTAWPMRIDVEPHEPASSWRRFVQAVDSILPIRSLL